MKKTLTFTIFLLLGSLILNAIFFDERISKMNANRAFQLEEPLLIEGQHQNSYSILPTGSILYYDKSWDEGHSTYHVYFNFKGDFKSSEVVVKGIDPIWLRSVPKEELPKLISEYPVSVDDLTIILKATRVTKQDLVQILRDWED